MELTAQTPSLSAKVPAPWGARLQAAIPPIVDAPVFALRKAANVIFSLGDYVARGIVSRAQSAALADAVRRRDNILIGDGTGSGKTTFANALVKVIADDTTDRVYIVEDTPELQCTAPNRLRVLVQPGVHTWRDAVMAAMRFRPDRIHCFWRCAAPDASGGCPVCSRISPVHAALRPPSPMPST